jgi:hypothetical protein
VVGERNLGQAIGKSPFPIRAGDGEVACHFSRAWYVTETDLPLIPVLKVRPEYVVYGPLAESAVASAVVLLFVNAAQALIASEAAQQVENPIMPAMRRPACAVISYGG